MQHGMTVRADRSQVPDWVDLIFSPDRGDIDDMVNVNEPASNSPVAILEVKLTYSAATAIMVYCLASRLGAAFVLVDQNGTDSAFG
ncbi:hypothetical protein R52603_05282 [Paraburkholderia saeva]|nr:hypothetical protein R52603_05282 [Paraburkholderia saeva]